MSSSATAIVEAGLVPSHRVCRSLLLEKYRLCLSLRREEKDLTCNDLRGFTSHHWPLLCRIYKESSMQRFALLCFSFVSSALSY